MCMIKADKALDVNSRSHWPKVRSNLQELRFGPAWGVLHLWFHFWIGQFPTTQHWGSCSWLFQALIASNGGSLAEIIFSSGQFPVRSLQAGRHGWRCSVSHWVPKTSRLCAQLQAVCRFRIFSHDIGLHPTTQQLAISYGATPGPSNETVSSRSMHFCAALLRCCWMLSRVHPVPAAQVEGGEGQRSGCARKNNLVIYLHCIREVPWLDVWAIPWQMVFLALGLFRSLWFQPIYWHFKGEANMSQQAAIHHSKYAAVVGFRTGTSAIAQVVWKLGSYGWSTFFMCELGQPLDDRAVRPRLDSLRFGMGLWEGPQFLLGT